VFTGIIEHLGIIESLEVHKGGGRITVEAPSIAPKLAISNSIAVNGCCLTVVFLDKQRFSADLSGETLQKSSFQKLRPGARVNLEQPLTAGKEFGGHFVLGHVDAIGRVIHLTREGESWWLGIEIPEEFARYIIPKGSITVDGISLTVARWKNRVAEVAVIPFTYEHTNIRERQPGDAVNLEGDVLGKYVERYLEGRKAQPASSITLSRLIEEGF
jgi:riboflavin synthase